MRTNVIIGGQTFIIERNSPSEELSNKYDGRIFYDKNKIYLSNNCEISYQDEVLAHEIIHGLVEKSGVASILKKSDVNEELVVELLSNIFWNFLKDNTDFFIGNKEVL